MSWRYSALLLVHLPEHPLREDLREAEDRVERGAKFVRHVGEELGLMAAGRLELPALVRDLPEEPRVLDGKSRLGRERREEAHDLRRKLAWRLAANAEGADDALLQEQGHGQDCAIAGLHEGAADRALVAAFDGDVGHLDGLPRRGRAADDALPLGNRRRPTDRIQRLRLPGIPVAARPQPKHLRDLVVLEDGAGVGPGQLAGASHDRLEHRVQIEGRTERPPHIAERPKLAHGARQVLGPGFEFREQPHVLDGDHGLVGECFRKRDLLVGEGLHFSALHEYGANGSAFAEERRDQHCPRGRVNLPPAGYCLRVFGLGQRLEVLNVDCFSIGNCPPNHGPRVRCNGSEHRVGRPWPIDRNELEGHALQSIDRGIGRPAESCGAFGHDVHDGLEIRRRARDDPQDLSRGRLLLERFGHLGMGLRESLVFLLQLREQAHVLDRDHRLIREGLKELDLARGKRTDHTASDRDSTERYSVAQHRHAHQASHAQ